MTDVAVRSVRVVVQGLVQGVGFRWFVRERAREHDLAGWVRNMPDGAVEFVASGNTSDVKLFLDATRIGPRGARVDTCQVDEHDARDLERPFYIRR